MAPAKRRAIETPLLGIELFSLEEQFYQYDWRCLLILEHSDEHYLYVPVRPAQTTSQWRIKALPVVRLSDMDRWLDAVRRRFRPLLAHPHAIADTDRADHPIATEVDASPWIRGDLRRLAVDKTALQATLAALDLFACFRGCPRDNAAHPRTLLGRDAVELLRLRHPAALTEPVRTALEADGIARAAGGFHQYLAVVDRNERPEGQSGGYDAEVAVVSLRVSTQTDEWSYERLVVWSESREGDPWS